MKAVFIAYYVYCLLLVFGTGYVVFWLNNSGWWFLVTMLLCNISPEIKENKNANKN
jgi:hypothetical protein